MTVWRCNCYDSNLGTLVSWWSSKQGATAKLLRFTKERGEKAAGPEGVEQVTIPTDKEGLLDWLNAHFTSDNG